MNKDEILKRSRNENKGQDEMERDVDAKAGRQAASIGLLVCMLLNLAELLIKGQANLSAWIVWSVIMGTKVGGQAVLGRQCHKSTPWLT